VIKWDTRKKRIKQLKRIAMIFKNLRYFRSNPRSTNPKFIPINREYIAATMMTNSTKIANGLKEVVITLPPLQLCFSPRFFQLSLPSKGFSSYKMGRG
jgi:predicted RNA-binding protein with EMAP domain